MTHFLKDSSSQTGAKVLAKLGRDCADGCFCCVLAEWKGKKCKHEQKLEHKCATDLSNHITCTHMFTVEGPTCGFTHCISNEINMQWSSIFVQLQANFNLQRSPDQPWQTSTAMPGSRDVLPVQSCCCFHSPQPYSG